MVGLSKWNAAKVSEVSGTARCINRICDGRLDASLTCLLRSFVLLAPCQSAVGFL